MKVKFYGTRGSIPVAEKNFMEYGGNTSCILVTFDNGFIAILDAGSGLRKLGQELVKQTLSQPTLPIILSHTHWDHIQGFPFFLPAYQSRFNVSIFLSSRGTEERDLRQIFTKQMVSDYFPVELGDMKATLTFTEPKQKSETLQWGAVVTACPLQHPGNSYGYRFEYNKKTVVYCTDIEHDDHIEPSIVELAKNADVLIHDAQYTPEELKTRKGWGHSSWAQAIELAKQAGVKRLALFHHDPDHDDDFLSKEEMKCQAIFPNSFFAKEGMEVEW
jgi:phosphoribosyl 1,2-cyclic phosphodiesterase